MQVIHSAHKLAELCSEHREAGQKDRIGTNDGLPP